ncbi:MAG: chromosome segregation protein SMC [Gammaproteobacteria bacterium]|nr:chromosome segregation protein SMC [Gammaproteobacteria bacterium]
MRLSKIKLAGFKSFVDPTTINLPGNLTGIVGPNGCGKSNVIDAVRWVMGESSAKHLRGSSMEDVIFNGSSSRKPVGMASVELVFDNSETHGKVGGQFAQYDEISVKRTVTRDGQSKYSLNGTRCRRRDIADLFLGTGLGPRSYAIIEQGMISRLIEAKPEELRIFLEEAAGISKYKERRRETENRIQHTRDNLDRLDDLREEIDKQLSHLQRQSRSAERYKEYKNEERQLKAEMLALHWRDLKKNLDVRDKAITETETKLEQIIAEQRAAESRIEQDRQSHTESNDALNAVQARYYGLGSDISRIEQNIKHQQDLQQRQKADLAQVESALAEATRTLQSDRNTIEEVTSKLQADQPALETLKADEQIISERFKASEEAMQAWQLSWDDINRRYSESSQKAQVERSRMEQLERHVEQLNQRLQRIDVEQQALRGEDIEGQIVELKAKLSEVEQQKKSQEEQLSSVLTSIRETREKIVLTEQKLAEHRRGVHDVQGRLSSLETLQQSALGKTDKAVNQWLERQGLASQARFAEKLQVDSGWETAVETVLGNTLEAICVDQIDALCATLSGLDKSNLSLIETQASASSASGASGYLLEKVTSSVELKQFIGGIRTADTLDAAMQMRAALADGESIVTRDGIWIGKHWLRISNDRDARQGVLARETEIRELKQRLQTLEAEASALNDDLIDKRDSLQAREKQREEVQVSLNAVHAQMNQLQTQISARQTRKEHISSRGQNLDAEKAEIERLMANEQSDIEKATLSRNESLQQIEIVGKERDQQEGQREVLLSQLQKDRNELQQQRDKAHELAIRIEGLNTRKQSLVQNIERMEKAQQYQIQRKQELQLALSQTGAPVEALEKELAELLEKRLKTEQELTDARRKVESIAQQLRSFEQQRSEHEKRSQDVRGQLEKMKLDSQEVRVRSKTVLEQLAEMDRDVDALLEAIEEGANSQAWEQKVAAIGERISRLGPINLAAIDEYQEQLKRKEYLDEQHKDVVSALEILEEAIGKIDRETRTRFKDTYDHVNSRLKEMFPRLFGGGIAYLELTGDDLLSTGVTVMAKPPGKRISNIHLMSGGEKALTAVALVFAIFELNPAPFCMLDEVDAPLDEANVGRFSQLVKEMSDQIQFIYITHNKTTMEISEHLSGVTMREAGVSRLVSVDVAEAATMAAV